MTKNGCTLCVGVSLASFPLSLWCAGSAILWVSILTAVGVRGWSATGVYRTGLADFFFPSQVLYASTDGNSIPSSRNRMPKIWTAKHSGDMDLLRTCLADPTMRGWKEEQRSDVRYGKKCQVAWVDRTSISGISRINYRDLGSKTSVSRFEGMREISDKVETERALERCRLVGMPGFESGSNSYFPQTWRLPEQLNEFKSYVQTRRVQTKKGKRSPTFIIKPGGGSEGNGIVLVRHERNIPRYIVPTKPAVAQSYVAPLLFEGRKFDLRLYVLVRSVDPLEVLIHTEGLARFCTEDYEAPTDDNLNKAYSHLTNYSLNKRSDGFVHMGQGELQAAAAAARAAVAAAGRGDSEVCADEEDEESEGEGARSVASSHSFLEARVAFGLAASATAAGAEGGAAAMAREQARVLEEETEEAEVGDGLRVDDDDDDDDNGLAADEGGGGGEGDGTDGQEAEGAYTFEGCSKRPVSVVLHELEAMGLIDRDELWAEIKQLTALTCVALQPELAVAYRANFPHKGAAASAAEAAALVDSREAAADASSRRAFQVLGIDILIDKKGKPRLLEVNSNPSMLIDFEYDDPDAAGCTIREPSPVDILVKRRVITDVLRYVVDGRSGTAASGGGRRTFLEPVVGGDAGMPREWTLLDRARRLFSTTVKGGGRGEVAHGMSSSAFVRLVRDTGLLQRTGLSKTDLELLFLRITKEQFDHRSLGLHSFARALMELADLAFASAGERADRLEALLAHIAAQGGGASTTGTSISGADAAAAMTARTSTPPNESQQEATTLCIGCRSCGEAAHLPSAVFCHRCGVRLDLVTRD